MPKKKLKSSKLKPNPVRQAILVVLALAGVGIGYGMGFVFKKDTPATSNPPAVMEAQKAAPDARKTETVSEQSIVEDQAKTVLPESHAGDETARAYEEALPKEIVKLPALTVPPRVDNLSPQLSPPTADITQPAGSAGPQEATSEEAAEASPETAAEVLADKYYENNATHPEVAHHPEPSDIKTEELKRPDSAAPDLLMGWQKNALEVQLTDKPKIAIVIDDMGVDQRRTRITTELHGPLTLSYLTYAKRLKEQTQAARLAGHELLLHVPMEPSSDDVDPGPNVLLSGVPAEEIRAALNWGLEQFEGYVGINNHMGSRFTSNLDGMKTVMTELRKRELVFLDSVTSGSTKGQLAAHQIGVPFIARNIFLDHIDNIDKIRDRLEQVKRLARKQGYAVAIGHPRDATIKALEPWLASIEEEGFQLVPISALIKLASMPETASTHSQTKEAN